jgi:hypothetical protein
LATVVPKGEGLAGVPAVGVALWAPPLGVRVGLGVRETAVDPCPIAVLVTLSVGVLVTAEVMTVSGVLVACSVWVGDERVAGDAVARAAVLAGPAVGCESPSRSRVALGGRVAVCTWEAVAEGAGVVVETARVSVAAGAGWVACPLGVVAGDATAGVESAEADARSDGALANDGEAAALATEGNHVPSGESTSCATTSRRTRNNARRNPSRTRTEPLRLNCDPSWDYWCGRTGVHPYTSAALQRRSPSVA